MIVRAPEGAELRSCRLKQPTTRSGSTTILSSGFLATVNRGWLLPRIQFLFQLARLAAPVTWNTCCSSEGQVTLTKNDSADEKVFASGQSGLGFLDGIEPGAHYEFRLYSAQRTAALQTASLTAKERTASIVAHPNPVATGSGLGRTRISWTTLGSDLAEVWVSQDGGPEQLLARGPAGSVEARWIATGSSYEFRLYSRDTSRRLLAKTVVKR